MMITFFVITLFNSGSGEGTYTDTIEKEFCGPCAFTGQWKVHEIDSSPCFKTNEACLDFETFSITHCRNPIPVFASIYSIIANVDLKELQNLV